MLDHRFVGCIVAEGTNESAPCVVYELDRTLKTINVGFREDFAGVYLPMRAKNPKLPSPRDLMDQLKRGVEVWRKP